jgi:hypothetical protein
MAYDIELNSPNLDKFDRGLDASLSKVERLAGAINELGGSASLLASKSSISGPYSRLASAQAKFAAITPGDASPEARDVTLALRKAEMAAGRADKFGKPISRTDALSNLFMTSRMGIGSDGFSMMPLMNKMFSPGNASALFGEAAGASISAMAGPFAAAATAIAGMTVAARAYSAFVRDSAGAHYLGGGNADVTASARGIAGLAGMSGTDFAGRSVQFGDFLRSGGPGAGYFRSKGLIDRGWLQGDKTSNMLRAMDILRAEPNEDLAIRAAREAGLSDMMWMRDISRGSYERIKRGMAPVSAMERRVNANITADVEANSQSFSNNIGRPTARLLQNGMQAWNPTMMQTFYGPFLGGALDDMMREMGWNPMRLGDVANGSNGSGGRGSSPAKKLEDAAEKLADAGRTLKEGAEQIGGGGRSRGAIPGQWKFMQMEDAITGQAAKLGAFSI